MPPDFGRSNYNDEPATQERVSSPAESRDGEDGRQGEGDHGEPQLINDAICPDAEVGTEFVVRVEKKMEGQLLVSYSDKPKDEEAPKEGESPELGAAPPERDPSLSAMYS